MAIETRPLAEVTQKSIEILLQRLGAVNTARFLNRFAVGYEDYTAEKEALFGHLTLDELINDIKQQDVSND